MAIVTKERREQEQRRGTLCAPAAAGERSSSYSFLRRSFAGFYEAKITKLHFVQRACPIPLSLFIPFWLSFPYSYGWPRASLRWTFLGKSSGFSHEFPIHPLRPPLLYLFHKGTNKSPTQRDTRPWTVVLLSQTGKYHTGIFVQVQFKFVRILLGVCWEITKFTCSREVKQISCLWVGL